MVFVRQSDGSVAFKVDEAYGRFDDGMAPDDGGDIDDGGNTYIDTTPSYTYNELIAMRREAQEKIYQTELDLKRRGSNTKRSNSRSTTAWSTARSTA